MMMCVDSILGGVVLDTEVQPARFQITGKYAYAGYCRSKVFSRPMVTIISDVFS